MNVEALWQRGYHVDWRTGVSGGPPEMTPGSHTHCSAFTAAVADRLGIYQRTTRRSTAQNWLTHAPGQWLNSRLRSGWRRVGRLSDPGASRRAVALANQGKLVIADPFSTAARNDLEDRRSCPGTRRSFGQATKSPELIESEGPDEIQAGMTNHRMVALRDELSLAQGGVGDGRD